MNTWCRTLLNIIQSPPKETYIPVVGDIVRVKLNISDTLRAADVVNGDTYEVTAMSDDGTELKFNDRRGTKFRHVMYPVTDFDVVRKIELDSFRL
jgi:hypothetical protein